MTPRSKPGTLSELRAVAIKSRMATATLEAPS